MKASMGVKFVLSLRGLCVDCSYALQSSCSYYGKIAESLGRKPKNISAQGASEFVSSTERSGLLKSGEKRPVRLEQKATWPSWGCRQLLPHPPVITPPEPGPPSQVVSMTSWIVGVSEGVGSRSEPLRIPHR